MTRTPTPKSVALAVAATLTIGAGTATVAGAADGTSSKPAAPTPEQRAEKREAAKQDRQAAFARELGVSVQDLQRARGAVRDAAADKRAAAEKARAEAQGLSVEQLRDRRADRVQKRLGRLVAKKRLTQAEADGVSKAVREGKPVRPQVKKALKQHAQDHRASRAGDRR